jgi:beta-glucanase (GH16 family)
VIGLAVLFLALAAGCACALGTQSGVSRSDAVWRLVFFDGFRHGLKATRWARYSGQPAGDPGGWWAPSHVTVSQGVVSLQTYRDPRFGRRWVSGGISSAPALKQTYGKYLVRMKMDPGKGVAAVALLWPVADRWPPEIDFAENGGATNTRDHITATLHYGAGNNQIQRSVRRDFTRWHTIGVKWTPGSLVYTLDGTRWAAISNSAVPAESMELDLQTQAGTCGDVYAPCPDSTTPAHVNVQIDWVAAYAYRSR